MKSKTNEDFGIQYTENGQPADKRSIPAIEDKTEHGSSKISSELSEKTRSAVKEKKRTHQGQCVVCGNRVPEERIFADFNEPFCCDRCERYFHRSNNIPENVGIKFTHHIAAVSLKMSTSHSHPSLWQNVLLYDKEKGLPANFIPLRNGREL